MIQGRKAAQAAKLSAEAVIAGERAWLLMKDIGGPSNPQKEYYACPIWFKNFGKTPARLVAVKIVLHVMIDGQIPSDMPNPGVIVPAMIPQDTDMPYLARSNISTAFDIQDRRYSLWLCGVVRYEDIFRQKPVHETRFCYIYEDRSDGAGVSWHMAGPPEYNQTI